MPDIDPKLPVGIVNAIIDRIADFTKEIELLRAQLPENNEFHKSLSDTDTKLSGMITKMSEKLDKTMTVIKTVFVLAMIVVGLSFFGAQILNYQYKKNLNTEISHKMHEQITKERKEDLKKIIDAFDKLKKSKEMKNNLER